MPRKPAQPKPEPSMSYEVSCSYWPFRDVTEYHKMALTFIMMVYYFAVRQGKKVSFDQQYLLSKQAEIRRNGWRG
jgi:hypothetical protein